MRYNQIQHLNSKFSQLRQIRSYLIRIMNIEAHDNWSKVNNNNKTNAPVN